MRVITATAAILASVLALAVGLAAAAGAAVMVWGEEMLARLVRERTDLAAGQDLTLGGPVRIDWGRTTTLALADVAVSNPPWAPVPNMMTADRVVVGVHLPSLLRGVVDVSGLLVERPVLHLSTDRAGRGNWTVLGQEGGPGGGGLPLSVKLREARVTGGQVTYTGPVDQPWPVVRVERLSARLDDLGGPLAAEATGTARAGKGGPVPLSLHAKAGPVDGTFAGARSYPVSLAGEVGTAGLSAEGTLAGPLSAPRPDLRVSLRGTGTAALSLVAGTVPPDLPPYGMDARLTREGTALVLAGIDATLGETRATGRASLDFGGGKPWVEANLSSPALHMGQAAGLFPSGGGDGAAGGGLIPDTPIPAQALRGIGGHARIEAKELAGLPVPLGPVLVDATLRDGTLSVETIRLSGLGGAVEGRLALDAAAEPARAQARWDVRGLALGQVLTALGLPYGGEGTVDGTGRLDAAGGTVGAMAGSADGTAELRMGQGSVSASAIKYLVLGLGDALSFLVPDKDPQAIRCAVGRFAIQDGVARPEPLLLATGEMALRGTGTADLGEETLDLRLVPRPEDPRLLRLTVPVAVKGTFANPRVDIGVNAELGTAGLDEPACPPGPRSAVGR